VTTFKMPAGSEPLEFTLTVTNSTGSSTDTIRVTPIRDVLTLTGEVRTRDGEVRIDGTATVITGNTVNVVLVDNDGDRYDSGPLAVDVAGAWRLRLDIPEFTGATRLTATVTSGAGGSLTQAVTIDN
jgi:hypothetical protein